MKVSVELDLNVVRGDADPKFTSLQGYLPGGTTYDQIVSLFGEPSGPDRLDGKTKAEWVGRINGLVFTIYDYNAFESPEHNTNWHIGGKIKLTALLVNAYLNKINGLR